MIIRIVMKDENEEYWQSWAANWREVRYWLRKCKNDTVISITRFHNRKAKHY